MKTKKKVAVGYSEDILNEGEGTVFRRYFKYYKQRAANPDLSNVFDLTVSNSQLGIHCCPLDVSLLPARESLLKLNTNEFRPPNEWTLTTLKHRPGLYIFSNVFTIRRQLEWIQNCLLSYAEPPNATNLSAIGTYVGRNVYRKCREKLRWATMGNDYNWGSKSYGEQPRSDLPEEMKRFASVVSQCLGLEEMHADATVINYYPEKANLSPHVDESERDLSRPLISMSFGQSAIYLIGGTTLNDPVDALLLNSGDVLVLHADQRVAYHAIPRILKTTRFEADNSWGIDYDVLEFANNSRINVTLRQVDS